ncbi:MAG: CHAT domain-containing protein [Cyanobacteria bacterium]|jgi:hypothetical protein|nr:CHAT domain-containing protein [Cyanobacteria bacterium GSL.Bin1]
MDFYIRQGYVRPIFNDRIYYIFIGKRPNSINFDIPHEIPLGWLLHLRFCPKSILQAVDPLGWHFNNIQNHFASNIDFGVIFDDYQNKAYYDFVFSLPNRLIVIFLNSENNSIFRKLENLNRDFLISSDYPEIYSKIKSSINLKQRSFKDITDLLQKTKIIISKELNIKPDDLDDIQKENAEKAKKLLQDLDLQEAPNFNPNLVNTANLYQLLSLYKSDLISLKNIDHTDRVQHLLNSVQNLGAFKKSLIDFNSNKTSHSFYFPTLILAFPYIHPDHKKRYKEFIYKLDKKQQSIAKKIKKLKFLEQNINTYDYHIIQEDNTNSKIDINHEKLLAKFYNQELYEKQRRLLFLDFVGYLHSSFEMSPYIRVPERGSSLNAYISRLSPSQYKKTFNNHSIAKNITEIGKALSENMPSQVLDFLNSHGDGIFAISDLPIEWLLVNKVPLAFLCDVCRVPETGITSILSQFNTNSRTFYQIEEDILKKTFVICGAKSDDPIFHYYQKHLGQQKQLRKQLPYNTSHIQSKHDFFKEVNAIHPHLLIIDSHGGFDSQEEGSYIWMGDEKVTGSEIINNLPSIPLVILSCCWGTPIYGNSNTIAQAFFEKGTLSVLSTFLPISITKGFMLYFRILNNLSQAVNNGIHESWMNLISHTIRTAYFDDLLEPVLQKIGRKALNDTEYSNNRINWQAQSMYLKYRYKMYKKAHNFIYNSVQRKYKKEVKRLLKNHPVIPEFMLYTHLGRGDLIKFKSWLDQNNSI